MGIVGVVDAHSVSAVLSENPEHTLQFPTVTPGVCPCTIGNRVAYAVVTDSRPGITGEQVTPSVIAVSIEDGVQNRAKGVGGIGILGAAEDIAVTATKISICLGHFTGHGPKIEAGVCSFV